mgnify:CR=1 FL=1|tara:strand:- start:467 stop:661 length:195 start_codon:yes stop_codon:yes gene_type:complete
MSLAWINAMGALAPLESFLFLGEAQSFVEREEALRGGEYVIEKGLDGKFHVYCYGAHPGAMERR